MRTVMPFHTLAPGALRAAKLRAAARASVGQHRPLAPVHLPLTGLFNGLNGSGLSDASVTPPDTTAKDKSTETPLPKTTTGNSDTKTAKKETSMLDTGKVRVIDASRP